MAKTIDLLAEIKEQVALLKQSSARLVTFIEGNGKLGLLDRVNIIENCIEDQRVEKEKEEAIKKRRMENNDKINIALVVFIITNAIIIFKDIILKVLIK